MYQDEYKRWLAADLEDADLPAAPLHDKAIGAAVDKLPCAS